MQNRLQTIALPPACLALAALARISGAGLSPLLADVLLPLLATALLPFLVFASLHHAEAIATRLGEPFGTLILTMSITIIEVALIVSMMLNGENNPTLARESVFSTIMIVCTGIVGACLTLGAWKHREQDLRRQGANAYLCVLMATSVLTLILPDVTLSTGAGTLSSSQLAFVSCLSIALYGAFVFSQTVRHREHFLDEDSHVQHKPHAPAQGGMLASILLLACALIAVVILAEHVAKIVEGTLERLHFRQVDAIIGALISTLVLMPEAVSALRAASRNELQRSLNAALGSALATIGLTFPVVGLVSLFTGQNLIIGLERSDAAMLILALGINVVGLSTGHTTILTGLVHLVVFATFVFLIFVP